MAKVRLAARASATSAASVLVAALTLGLAGCGTGPVACAGQCGPPFQLRVVFRHGTSAGAGRAVLRACAAGNPQVERIGPVQLSPLAAGGKPEPEATVYTRSLGAVGAASRRLVDCLNNAPAVIGAGYPD